MIPFMFASGVENSAPTIGHGRIRRDQMEECGHYHYFRTDFDLALRLGVRTLRYGVPLRRGWLGPGRYDWDFADLAFGELHRLGIEPIVDLCHFGVPDWIGNFQNPDFPSLFAGYAGDFSQRYPWIRMYTPVNEISSGSIASWAATTTAPTSTTSTPTAACKRPTSCSALP